MKREKDEITEAFAPFTGNLLDSGRTHSEVSALIKNSFGGWSTKLGIGISLCANISCNIPFTESMIAEKRSNRYLWMPLKANFYIFDKKPINLYITIGGTDEKGNAGADNNSFIKELSNYFLLSILVNQSIFLINWSFSLNQAYHTT